MALDFKIEKFSKNEVLTPNKLNQMADGIQKLQNDFYGSVLESDGVTAKRATSAQNAVKAGNVTTTINGKAITEIFETNGTAVKRATTADKVANALMLDVNGESVSFNGALTRTVRVTSQSPNILINPDFTINQRGKNAYSIYNEYSVDRWKNCYGTTIINADGTITKTSGNSYQGIVQYIENSKKYAGKTLTFTAKADKGGDNIRIDIKIGTDPFSGTSVGYAFADSTGLAKLTVTIPTVISDGHYIMAILFNAKTNSTVKWFWAKLEEGDTATPFVSPEVTLEMMKCYRYYLKLAENAPYNGWIFGGDQARINFITPVQMRVTPTLSIEGGLGNAGIYTSGKTYNITSCNFHQYRGCALVAQMFLAVTAPASHAAAFRTVKYAYLDAEI